MRGLFATSAAKRLVLAMCVLGILAWPGATGAGELVPTHFGIFVVTGHRLKELAVSAMHQSLNNRGKRVLSLVGEPPVRLENVENVLTYGGYQHVAIWRMERVGMQYRLIIDSNDVLPFLYLDEALVQGHEKLTRYTPKVALKGGEVYVLTATSAAWGGRTSYYPFFVEKNSGMKSPTSGAVEGTWALVPPSSSSLGASLPKITLQLKAGQAFEMTAPSVVILGSYSLQGTTLSLRPMSINGEQARGPDAAAQTGTFFGRKDQWLELEQMPGAVFAKNGQRVAVR